MAYNFNDSNVDYRDEEDKEPDDTVRLMNGESEDKADCCIVEDSEEGDCFIVEYVTVEDT